MAFSEKALAKDFGLEKLFLKKKKGERRGGNLGRKREAGEGAEPLGLSELKLVGVVFSSKAALIDR